MVDTAFYSVGFLSEDSEEVIGKQNLLWKSAVQCALQPMWYCPAGD